MFWWGIDRDYDANRLQILLTIQSHSHECANKGRQAENDECALSGLQGEMHGFGLVRQRTELEVISNGIWHGKQSHARILYNRVTEPWSFLFWAQYGEKDKISFYFAIGTGMLNIFFWAHWPWQFLLNPRDGRIGSLLDSISPCEGIVGFRSWINLSYSSEEARRVESNVRLIFLTCTKSDPSTKCCLFSCPLWLPRAQESIKAKQ